MEFFRNFPFFCIVLTMMCGVISSVLKGKAARLVSFFVIGADGVMSACVLAYTLRLGDSFVYQMGHFPAPWGNEIRAGVLEALFAVFFCLIMFLSLLGGLKNLEKDVEEGKKNLYFVMVDLMLASLLALIYTNDLFTAYVFVEINTIAACGLIMIRDNGHTLVAAVKYMIMSLLGSGLILIGISMLYDLTGHLLMSNIRESVSVLAATGEYAMPLTVIIGLMSVGLAIKSALYPFHLWLPDAYGYSTASSSAILSSLVSKGYIFLLIKIFFRVIGMDVIVEHKVTNLLFVFGIIGMIMGSISAMKEKDIRRMVAFSSIAQIGYIYMGIGLGTSAGIIAACFHVFSHAATKSMLFIASHGLSEVSGGSKRFADLKGSGWRNRTAGIAFTVGALSMVGLPMFAGFVSKLYFASAAVGNTLPKMIVTLVALAVSTILNAMYFIRAVITIYTPTVPAQAEPNGGTAESGRTGLSAEPVRTVAAAESVRADLSAEPGFSGRIQEPAPGRTAKEKPVRPAPALLISTLCLIALNFALGMFSEPIIRAMEAGLKMFS